MDVSVIMINYNTFDLTKAAIESIFAHTEGISFEVILVDNLSPDGSGERLREIFKNKIIYLQSGGNLGTSKAFNLGLKQASGKYILWLLSNPFLTIWKIIRNAGFVAGMYLILRAILRILSEKISPI